MVYSCFSPAIFYGFAETNSQVEIDPEWLEDNVEVDTISVIFDDVIREYGCKAIYGIGCILDPKTGKLIISEEEKKNR